MPWRPPAPGTRERPSGSGRCVPAPYVSGHPARKRGPLVTRGPRAPKRSVDLAGSARVKRRGPAPAGDPPAVHINEDLEEYHAGDETVSMEQRTGDDDVLDEYTGDVLPPELVRKAREEEAAMMESCELWGDITREEAWRLVGKNPQGQVG